MDALAAGETSSSGATRLASVEEAPVKARAPVASGTRLGRYLVLGELGRGGMGVVLRAYDPRLEREVALKSVKAETLSGEAHERMLLEAQAMAKLSHPNVVAVYDVDVLEGDVVIAMEHVRGVTLGAWLEAGEGGTPRTWREVLHAFVEAGQGLAAAHAAGLLHRDFKPANVLVGDDGRVCVTDFGIACVQDGGAQTGGGSRAGTPWYMAPEQHAGEELSAAADQYAYCVALFEALTGRRLFEGAGADIETTKRRGAPRWPKEQALRLTDGVPSAVAAALKRGLNPVPGERWPSMAALLEVLASAQKRRGSRWMVAASTVMVLGMSSITWAAWQEHQAQRCSGAQEQIAQVWNAERKAQVEQAMLATGLAYAPKTVERVGPALDRYAAAWAAGHRDACEATTVRGEQPAKVMDLRMVCLHRAKQRLIPAVDLLARADAVTVEEADDVVGSLLSIARCSDVEMLDAEVVPPDEEDEEAVETVRQRLAEAEVLADAGKDAEAAAIVDELLPRIDAIGYGPLHTEAKLMAGLCHHRLGRHIQAKAVLEEAFGSALRCRQRAEAMEAAVALVKEVGLCHGQVEQAEAHALAARGLMQKGSADEAHLHFAFGFLRYHQGRLSDAEREFRAGVALLERLGGNELLMMDLRWKLGIVITEQGRLAEGFPMLQSGIDAYEQFHGPEHPDMLPRRVELAVSKNEAGASDEAETMLRDAVDFAHKTLGPEHQSTLYAQHNLASVLNSRKHYLEALESITSVMPLWDRGGDRVGYALGRIIAGDALAGLGRHEEAEAQYRAALTLHFELFGAEDGHVVRIRQSLAAVLHQLGRDGEASEHLRLALQAGVALEGTDSLSVGSVRRDLAEVLAALARYDEAEAELAAAQSIFEAEQGPDHADVLALRERRAELAGKRRGRRR